MQVAPVLLRVLPDEGGSVRIEVSDGAGRPAHAVVSADALAATTARAGQLLRPPMGVLLPGQDRRASEAEQQAGRLLAALVRQPSLAARLDTLLGHAAGAGQQAVVVVDAEDPRARALPWELLADAVGGRLQGRSESRPLGTETLGRPGREVVEQLPPLAALRQAMDRDRAEQAFGLELGLMLELALVVHERQEVHLVAPGNAPEEMQDPQVVALPDRPGQPAVDDQDAHERATAQPARAWSTKR